MKPPQVTFQELGLPDEVTVRQLLYSAPAETIICQVELRQAPTAGARRLYAKQLADSSYSVLGPVAVDETYEYPVACPISPSLYYLSSRVTFNDGRLSSGSPHGVYCRHLGQGAKRAVIEMSARGADDFWVSSLNGISADGQVIYCAAAFSQRIGKNTVYNYHLCALDTDSGALRQLGPLRACFA